MSKIRFLSALFVCVGLLAIGISALPGCGDGRKKVRVFAADALTASFRELEAEYEKAHPDTNVECNFKGSIVLCRLAAMSRADVIAVADHRLVEKILAPKHAAWVAKFASTEIVLAGTSASKYRDEITTDNWLEILMRPDVTYGVADPSQDPCGYYTRLAWALAAKHYKQPRVVQKLIAKCPKQHVARDALSLISEHLGTNRVDYAFLYRVHAKDLKLPYTPLPREINLGDPSLSTHYETAEALVPNYRGGTETLTGAFIAFGVTSPPDALNPEGAESFIKFLLSKKGRTILGRSEFRPIEPALIPAWSQSPAFLGDLAAPEDGPPKTPPPPAPATAKAP